MLTWPVLAIGQQTSPTPGTSGAGTHMEQQGQAGQQGQQAMHHEQSQQAMHHEQIEQAQRQLKAAGFDPGLLDGILGESTRSALREFQQKHSLPQTGQLDEATRQQLMAQAPQQTPSSGTSSGSASGR